MNQNFVILFSKYSPVCKKFVEIIENAKLNINFNLLCIDNSNIRDRIKNSNDIDIKQVPCLLILSGKNIDKYEGQDCFIWINDIIIQQKNLLLQQQQEQQIILQQQMNEKFIQDEKPNNDKQQFAPEQNNNTFTAIDDIDSNLEDEDMLGDIKIESTYRDFDVSGNGAKKRPDHAKRENLLSAAMQMQKSRELEDKNISKNPNF
jgi:hypothetical protein